MGAIINWDAPYWPILLVTTGLLCNCLLRYVPVFTVLIKPYLYSCSELSAVSVVSPSSSVNNDVFNFADVSIKLELYH